MIELKTTDLNGLVKDLRAIAEQAKKIDKDLTSEILEMGAQLEADNYGTPNPLKKVGYSGLISKMDAPDKLQEVSEALASGIEQVIKNQ